MLVVTFVLLCVCLSAPMWFNDFIFTTKDTMVITKVHKG